MKKFLSILGLLILIILVVILAFVAFVIFKSASWEENFLSKMNRENLVTEGTDFVEVINEKIDEYILSSDDTDYITLTSSEVAYLVYGALEDVLGENSKLQLDRVYVEPAEGIWGICARLDYNDLIKTHVWICADVTKDDMQTAQIYLTEISIQGFKASQIYPKLVTLANQGIANALVTANENGFVGRIFENMEFFQSTIVIKGSIY